MLYPERTAIPKTNTVRIALINGIEVEYDAMKQGELDEETKQFYASRNHEYLGSGSLYSIDNVPQRGFDNCHFWKKSK